MKVGQVIISNQKEENKNYKEFLELIKQKNIKVHKVLAGNKIHNEKDIYFDILWPTDKMITENSINNNAIVCNLHYKKFSMLFTGDIEKIAEERILELYKSNIEILKTDILKVGHHRFKNI